MRRLPLVLTLCVLPLVSAQALDERSDYAVAEALGSTLAQRLIKPDIALHFAGGGAAPNGAALGPVEVSRKGGIGLVDYGPTDRRFPNTIAGNHDRTTRDACQKAFLTALRDLQAKARAAGADAVVDIRSNYRGEEKASASHYVCGHGAWAAGVALKGRMIRRSGADPVRAGSPERVNLLARRRAEAISRSLRDRETL